MNYTPQEHAMKVIADAVAHVIAHGDARGWKLDELAPFLRMQGYCGTWLALSEKRVTEDMKEERPLSIPTTSPVPRRKKQYKRQDFDPRANHGRA